MLPFSRFKKEAVMIRRIFKGEPEAYRLLIERYQPMAYAIAMANSGSVFLADKITAAAFESGYGRLISLTDPRKLGQLMCGLAHQESENLLSRRATNWNIPRTRLEVAPVDLQWIQTELIEPLMEELGSFTLHERMGILLNTFAGLNARQIADVLKIDPKDAAEDLARTRENVESALLKEVRAALYLEVNSRERLGSIISTVGGRDAADKAMSKSRLGRRKSRKVPLVLTACTFIVIGISAYFGYYAFNGAVLEQQPNIPSSPAPTKESSQEPATTEPPANRPVPVNYSLIGRVVDNRFREDGVAGVTVKVQDKEAVTDSYGAFELRGVARGEHRVSISYGDEILKSDVRLHTNEKNLPIAVDLTDSVPTRFTMIGQVTDRATGQVLKDIEQACIKENSSVLFPFILDLFKKERHEDGRVQIRLLTPGEYTAWVRAKGYAPLAVSFVIDENWDPERVFEFPLYRAALLEGVVYSASELSISGAGIMPRDGSRFNLVYSRFSYGNTDSKGHFALYDLPLGVHNLLIGSEEHGSARAIVVLEAGKTTTIRAQVPHASSFSGDITLYGLPVKFKELRRRQGGNNVDLLKNVVYLSPGQYELPFTPEAVHFWGSVEPLPGDTWFERRIEQESTVDPSQPVWVDFNFNDGKGSVQGNVSFQGNIPRSAFAEVTLEKEDSRELEKIYYDLGTSGSYRAENLPLRAGSVTVYASDKALSRDDFWQNRSLLNKKTASFSLSEGKPGAQLNFNL